MAEQRIHGSTRQERDASRAKRRDKRRTAFFMDEVRGAVDLRERLAHACRYLRAVADDLPDAEVRALAVDVAKLAENAQKRITQNGGRR